MVEVGAICLTWLILKMIPAQMVPYIIYSELLFLLRFQVRRFKICAVCCSAWDYSAWVRCYALFLEERLECFHVLKCDVETDRPVSSSLTY